VYLGRTRRRRRGKTENLTVVIGEERNLDRNLEDGNVKENIYRTNK
jgi:hypothetical protein